MRAGTLRHRAILCELDSNLAAVEIGARWVGIRTKDRADVPAALGLRSQALVEVRSRFSNEFRAGRYLRQGDRLLHITSARDPLGNRAELVMSCEELVGECAEYWPPQGLRRTCRVFLNTSAPYLDELGQVIDYRRLAEVALIEVGRVQVDDQLRVRGVLYNVIGIANRGDDGVVRGLWLEEVG